MIIIEVQQLNGNIILRLSHSFSERLQSASSELSSSCKACQPRRRKENDKGINSRVDALCTLVVACYIYIYIEIRQRLSLSLSLSLSLCFWFLPLKVSRLRDMSPVWEMSMEEEMTGIKQQVVWS